MKKLMTLLVLTFLFNTAYAQFDKGTCEAIMSAYKKSNADFKYINVATLDRDVYKLKFDIGWLKDFKFEFMDKVLKIEYSSDQGTYQVYIPYNNIIKINTSKTALDIIIRE